MSVLASYVQTAIAALGEQLAEIDRRADEYTGDKETGRLLSAIEKRARENRQRLRELLVEAIELDDLFAREPRTQAEIQEIVQRRMKAKNSGRRPRRRSVIKPTASMMDEAFALMTPAERLAALREMRQSAATPDIEEEQSS